MKLFLFPYAGSLGLGYNQWLKKLRKEYEVYRFNYTDLVEGQREYRFQNWDDFCEALYKKVSKTITDGDYIMFGHSMGSRAAYEMYRRIVANGLPRPKQIIFSGCEDLSCGHNNPEGQTEASFREEYIAMGGISDEVLSCEELADMAFDDLRLDATLLSKYRYHPAKIECPVMVLNGEDDKRSSKEEWEALLGSEVDWRLYQGKHFFIYEQADEILRNVFSITG